MFEVRFQWCSQEEAQIFKRLRSALICAYSNTDSTFHSDNSCPELIALCIEASFVRLYCFSSPCSASYPSEPSDDLPVVQLPEGLPQVEPALLGFAPLAVDGITAQHLCHCPYHLHLLETWLMSGRELPESLHGQPLQTPHTLFTRAPSGQCYDKWNAVTTGQALLSLLIRICFLLFVTSVPLCSVLCPKETSLCFPLLLV